MICSGKESACFHHQMPSTFYTPNACELNQKVTAGNQSVLFAARVREHCTFKVGARDTLSVRRLDHQTTIKYNLLMSCFPLREVD
jgi:hypothetical protein